MMSRRSALAGGAAFAFGAVLPVEAGLSTAPEGLDFREIPVEGGGHGGKLCVAIPTHLAPGETVPLLVVLHGLAETVNPTQGARAWWDRYGLPTAYDRLRRPPVVAISNRGDLTPARVMALRADLVARPFRGLCVACPSLPNVNTAPSTSAALEAYGAWLVDVVVPTVRRVGPVATTGPVGLDGCSLGGFVGLEVFLRRGGAFAAWGGVQTAIGASTAEAYARRLEDAARRHGHRPLHLETSTGDPFRAATEALCAALRARHLPVDVSLAPGPHDQPWLREVGTLEMLLWHDRVLRGEGA